MHYTHSVKLMTSRESRAARRGAARAGHAPRALHTGLVNRRSAPGYHVTVTYLATYRSRI